MRKYGLLATFICAPVLFACSDNQNVDTAKADKDKAVKVIHVEGTQLTVRVIQEEA